MSTWLDLFRREGNAREVAGNRPLALNDPNRVWMIAAGRVDVFLVPLVEGEPAGSRIHLYRAEQGQALFGCPVDDDASLGLLAVGVPGTEVFELSESRRAELDGRRAEWAELTDAWIEGLTAGVARRQTPAQKASLLSAEGESRIAAGEIVTPAHGVFWIRGMKAAYFLGEAEAAPSGGEALFPLAESGWLEIVEAAELCAERTESLVDDSQLSAGLAAFHRAVLSFAAVSKRRAIEVERDRLAQKSHGESRLAASTLAELAATVEPESIEDALRGREESPLLAACRLVGRRLGVSIEKPRDFDKKTWSDPVGAIARASRLQTRRVVLTGSWWREDNGPLVAFYGEENRPVAVLPASATSYEWINPASGSRRLLNQADARKMGSFAHVFYRSFPTRPLTTRDILRFAMVGTRKDWLTVLLLGLVGGLLGLVVPIGTGLLFGRIIPAAAHFQLAWLALALTVAAVVMTLFEFVQGVASLRLETRTNSAVEAGVWDRLLNLPTWFFRKYSTGDLAMRATGIARIRQILTETAMSSVLTFLFSLVSFGLLFYLDVRLALLATAVFLIVTGATCWAAVVQLRYERESYKARGKTASIVLQLLTGISRLRVAGAERRALAFWTRSFSHQTRLAFQAQSVSNISSTFLATVPVLSSALVFGSVALLGSEKITLAVFLAFNAAFVQIIMASVTVGATVTSLLEIVPLYERAKPILATEPEVRRDRRDPGDLRGDLEISHVSFRYHDDGPLVLDDVSVRVRPGQFVAFVGPSGAGKSTILRLLLGFELPTSGSVYFDGEDLAGLDQRAVRSQMGVVLQNSQLSPGSILSNIVGSSGLGLEDAWEAARLSGLDQDIAQMPMQMYTVVTEGESTLSGGQRQRLLIARAIVSKPRILLFDEATSALDNVTQATVAESLDRLKATRIVVAHRLSTVIHADQIFVVDHGRIVEQGRYDELMARPGLFAELARRQLA
ncbi:MAG: NHLP bacteriocin export ABC transporter permease/ATPase subunit [Pirellulales bacterium]|nr:NHLP bacteriocin export ABC transporter permease/ATPase subunit [Pirellulales bacterium]